METVDRRALAIAAARKRTEASLLSAVSELLAEGTSFADIAIEAITQRAGVSRPTFYAYFADKRALVLRLGEELEAAIGDAVAAWLAGPSGDRDLRTTLEATFAVFAVHRATLGALVEAATYDQEVAIFWRGLHERFAEAARERLRDELPDLPETAARARSFALVWATERCFTEHLFAPRVDEEALMEALELLWSAGLGRERA